MDLIGIRRRASDELVYWQCADSYLFSTTSTANWINQSFYQFYADAAVAYRQNHGMTKIIPRSGGGGGVDRAQQRVNKG